MEVAGGAGVPGTAPWLSVYLHSCDLANGSDVRDTRSVFLCGIG